MLERVISGGDSRDDAPHVPTRISQGVDVLLAVTPRYDKAVEPHKGQVTGKHRLAARDLRAKGADGPLAVAKKQYHAQPGEVRNLLETDSQAMELGRAGAPLRAG